MSLEKNRRWMITINNPFFNAEKFREIDIDNTDLIVDKKHYNLDNLIENDVKDYFDFRYIERIKENEPTKVVLRPFFKNYECLQDFMQKIDRFKYACGQIECGELGTEHLQMYYCFSNSVRFNFVKNWFPTARIEIAKGKGSECRSYCTKKDTSVMPSFEFGEFSEERARTDISTFLSLIDNGVKLEEIKLLYPKLYLQHYDKLVKLEQSRNYSNYGKSVRNITVSYMYGSAGTGKTSSIFQKYGMENVYRVFKYKKGAYDNYNGEDVIVFDEFNSQIPFEEFLNLIDIYPFNLSARYSDRVACYTKVFIISNLSLREQYPDITLAQRMALQRRIHNIFEITDTGLKTIKHEDGFRVGVFDKARIELPSYL